MYKPIFLTFLFLLLLAQPPAYAVEGVEFDYYYRENERISATSGSADQDAERKDHLLSRGGKLNFEYYVIGELNYQNQSLDVYQLTQIEGATPTAVQTRFASNDSTGKASLHIPLGMFFIRADRGTRKFISYLDTPLLGLPQNIYYFDDFYTEKTETQSLGVLFADLGLELGGFQGQFTRERTITQSNEAYNLDYEILGKYRGLHLQKRASSREGLYLNFLYRKIQTSELEGEQIDSGANYENNFGRFGFGYGFDSGSRIYYRMEKQAKKLDFTLLTGEAILEEDQSQGYVYGFRFLWEGRGISLEKKVRNLTQEVNASNYLSKQEINTPGWVVGFGYDANLDFTLELATESHSLSKSSNPADPTALEKRDFEDSTLGFGFALYFY